MADNRIRQQTGQGFDEDIDPMDGIEGDTERLKIEVLLLKATDNSARPEDGEQPPVVED